MTACARASSPSGDPRKWYASFAASAIERVHIRRMIYSLGALSDSTVANVRQAVEAGEISLERYESYLLLRDEHQRLADEYWWGIQE